MAEKQLFVTKEGRYYISIAQLTKSDSLVPHTVDLDSAIQKEYHKIPELLSADIKKNEEEREQQAAAASSKAASTTLAGLVSRGAPSTSSSDDEKDG